MGSFPVFAEDRFDHNHSLWDKILKQRVTLRDFVSSVDYEAIHADPSMLKKYLNQIEALTPEQYERFSENEKLAFLINAYNAFTVKLIIDHYPVSSIKKIGGIFSSPWKKKFFKLFEKEQNLDTIEQDLIRKKFNEPRIHFVLVCASKGCPPLKNEAFVSTRLDQQLEEQALLFLRDKNRNIFIPEQMELQISSIFKWYGEDFVNKFGSVQSFVSSRMTSDPKMEKLILSSKVKISYLSYDWSLNGK